jgi:hypothetical protein
MAEEVQIAPIHQKAQQLVVAGYLPPPFTIDRHDSRPLWDFIGLAELLNQRPDQLAELLQGNGPVYQKTAGIPSSWRLLIEG